jgi:hypothetical protein
MSISKMVADRMAISATVESSLAVHGPEVASALEAILFPAGPPANLTVAAVLQAFHDALERNRDRLGSSDLAHAAELADDDAPRAARDRGLTALRATLVGLRATVLNGFGPGVLVAYGIPSVIPEAVDLVVRTATHIEERLRNRPLTEAPLQKGVSMDPMVIADDLKEQLAALVTALTHVETEKREAQLTLEAKNKVLAAWTGLYPGIAGATTSLYEVAGRQDLADVVRPTARRRAGLTEAADEAPEGSAPEGAPPVG